MPYDVVIKGGHVLDEASGLDGKMDIGITGSKIAAIEPSIDAAEAKRVIEVRGPNKYVTPGLLDIHTHVAHGAVTRGVGMGCCDPNRIGVESGVTTVLDCGSVGVANIGVFEAHILPKSKTRVTVFLNIGSHAHTMPNPADVSSMEDINRAAIAKAIENNPGLIDGIKLRMVGPVVQSNGEAVIDLCKAITREHKIPLMVHIGDATSSEERGRELTRYLLKNFDEIDILTHLCTPRPGGVMDSANGTIDELKEARNRGVTLDSALGAGNFGYEVAKIQADLGVYPDTISSDLTAGGQGRVVFSLLECMGRFMAVGYGVKDVIKMTTTNSAKALRRQDELGALKVGRDADISIIEHHTGDFNFVDTLGVEFKGGHALTPIQTVKAGEVFVPQWGPHPWGWLPPQGD